MGWTETCAMDKRKRFVEEVLADEQTMRAICERYGVSRKTGYKWLYRYEQEGRAGLEERARAAESPECGRCADGGAGHRAAPSASELGTEEVEGGLGHPMAGS